MKIVKLKLILFLSLTILSKFALADSPLTSTPFYEKYSDVSIVAQAVNLGAMNRDIANYLHNSGNPIDVKAAVINALGWNKNGRSDAEQYMSIIYNSAVITPERLEANIQENFVLGYLYAMDNYHDVKTAEAYLKQAKKDMSNSYTVNIIYNLVRAQRVMDENFCKAWKYVNKVFMNDKLNMDMRADARKVIYDYMVLYNSECK